MLPRTQSCDPCPTIKSRGSFQARWAGPTFHRVTKPQQGGFNDIPFHMSIFVPKLIVMGSCLYVRNQIRLQQDRTVN